jgi:hypothetical protein
VGWWRVHANVLTVTVRWLAFEASFVGCFAAAHDGGHDSAEGNERWEHRGAWWAHRIWVVACSSSGGHHAGLGVLWVLGSVVGSGGS